MAFPPHPGMIPPPPAGMGLFGTPPPFMPQGPGLMPPPPMPPVHIPLQPPIGMPMQHIIQAAPTANEAEKVPVALVTDMKVATTVFVGNISEKAMDTLVRQMLLRCGHIMGWKRVQDASGKLQAFGFCEFGSPDSTLRALRLLDGFRLGNKNLVVKVDSKTRKDLLKYLIRKRNIIKNLPTDERTLEKAVAELEEQDSWQAVLKEEPDKDTKDEDERVLEAINFLVKENVEVLSSSMSSEDARLEHDVRESLLSMAKQSGKVDPDTSLDDMEMEDGLKDLVSDEIKRFRMSYQKREREKMEMRTKLMEEKKDKHRGESEKPPSPKKAKSPSPPPPKMRGRSKSPVGTYKPMVIHRSRSQERLERQKRREKERAKEREESAREEEEYEQRQMARRTKDRERAYKERLQGWENRERRKVKEREKDKVKEDKKKSEMERERMQLAEFLGEYSDERDDSRYYKGNAYARRRRERECEIEEDRRDRQKEKDEIEALRLQVMEKQVLAREDEDSSSPEPSLSGDDEDMDVPVKPVEEEDIPLTKPGYTVPAAFVPIQVQSAPAVQAPELKEHPNEQTSDSIVIKSIETTEHGAAGGGEEEERELPSKLAFGFGKKAPSVASSSTHTVISKKAALESIFSMEDEEMEEKPKRKIIPIEYSEEEQQVVGRTNKISPEERKKKIQSLVNSIPTSKEELFCYELKWEAIDKTMMDKRVSPWINKKIVEYIGEEEQSLVEFICNKLACHIQPDNILSDIAMVLDEEAETFVMKLWRLLIYETEAKHLGISKIY